MAQELPIAIGRSAQSNAVDAAVELGGVFGNLLGQWWLGAASVCRAGRGPNATGYEEGEHFGPTLLADSPSDSRWRRRKRWLGGSRRDFHGAQFRAFIWQMSTGADWPQAHPWSRPQSAPVVKTLVAEITAILPAGPSVIPGYQCIPVIDLKSYNVMATLPAATWAATRPQTMAALSSRTYETGSDQHPKNRGSHEDPGFDSPPSPFAVKLELARCVVPLAVAPFNSSEPRSAHWRPNSLETT